MMNKWIMISFLVEYDQSEQQCFSVSVKHVGYYTTDWYEGCFVFSYMLQSRHLWYFGVSLKGEFGMSSFEFVIKKM